MSIFQELIEVNKEKKELEDLILKQKAQFEESIVKETERLKELVEKDRVLREEVCLLLEKNNETNVVIDDKSISRQTRKTLKIDNPSVLLASISANSVILKGLGIDIKEIQNAFKHDIVIGDKKVVMDVVEKYENVEGKLLEGVIEQKTNFLTIKDNK
ncbi:MAG: hypothetical protein WC511_07860 [Candidatus Pacearchaeota archaeon]|jgi:hypothetical protein